MKSMAESTLTHHREHLSTHTSRIVSTIGIIAMATRIPPGGVKGRGKKWQQESQRERERERESRVRSGNRWTTSSSSSSSVSATESIEREAGLEKSAIGRESK